MKKRILLIEDDTVQALTIRGWLKHYFPNIEIIVTEDEHSFITQMQVMDEQSFSPDLVICDVMLPWITGKGTEGAPDEVVQGSFREGGIRCWQRFRKRPRHTQVPWIYFSILTKEDMGFSKNSDALTAHVQKEDTIVNFLAKVRKFLV